MGSYDFRRDPRSRKTESTRPKVSRHVPGLQLGVNHDDREEPQFQQLLALHGLWRDLERLPSSHRAQRIVAVRGDTGFQTLRSATVTPCDHFE